MGKKSKNRLDRVYTHKGKSIFVGNIDACCRKDLNKYNIDAVVCVLSRRKIHNHQIPVLMETKMTEEKINSSLSSSSSSLSSSSVISDSDSVSDSDSSNYCINRKYKNGKVIYTPITSQIGVSDEESANIGQYLNSVSRFIKDSLQFTNVLVHCNQGKCRSATMVAAYLIRFHGMTVGQAHRAIKRKRPSIHIRKEFVKQLKHFRSKVQNK